MSEEINVRVIEYRDRKSLLLVYVDPITGKKKTRSAKTTDRKAADKLAAVWEAELQSGRYVAPSRITWEGFRQRYESEVLTGLSEGTRDKCAAVFNVVEKIISPKLLRDVNAERISYLQSKMRSDKRAENTILGHMAHLRAALQWAANVGIVATVPKIMRPKRAKGGDVMKGRPITLEEFERMLDVIPKALTQRRHKGPPEAPSTAIVASWRHYLRGLWTSGLRLAESLELSWDRDDKPRVDLDGRRPMLRIRAEHEKGHKDRLLPMAPEFAEFLQETPETERTGFVFHPLPLRPWRSGGRLTENRVGDIVKTIGKTAGVKVYTHPTTGKVKHATAHDLRRSFGQRWSTRVMPQVLMQLMRHESIETTLRFYVGRDADLTADVLWTAHEAGNKTGNSAPKPASINTKTADVNVDGLSD